MRWPSVIGPIAMFFALAPLSAFSVDTEPGGSMPVEGSNEAIPVAAPGAERIIGTYAAGCILGARPFPESTAAFELVNTARNHQYGHSSLIDFVTRLGGMSVAKRWGKLRVGDSSCPCGGKMGVGHSSHRIGLDVDIFYDFIPDGKILNFTERNSWDEKAQNRAEIAVYERPFKGEGKVESAMTDKFRSEHLGLLKAAATSEEVDRIFVSPPIKRKLCEVFYKNPAGDWRWLQKIRPWTGHKSHFHVRLKCPKHQAECIRQDAIPEDSSDKSGVGCEGDSFAEWFKPKSKPSPEAKGEEKAPTKTAAEQKCDSEIAKLEITALSSHVRCMRDSGSAVARCRDYRTARTFKVRADCSPSDFAANPHSCSLTDASMDSAAGAKNKSRP